MSTQYQHVLQNYAEGDFDPSILRYQQAAIPALAEQEVLVQVLYLSIDPTNRAWLSPQDTYLPRIELGEPMRGLVLGQVIESNSEKFNPGDTVYGLGLWQEYCAIPAAALQKVHPEANVGLENYANLYSLIGATAYVGMVEIGDVQPGQTVVVSGAAGATGSLACQIAKIKGCKVVGIAGGEAKCRYLLDIGCDAAVDYKSCDVSRALQEHCPDGVDVFFDNVGGQMLDEIIANNMALNSTIVMCGAISQYDHASNPEKQYHYKHILTVCYKRIRMQGFVIFDYADRLDAIYRALAQWHQQGSLVPRSHILEGLDKAPQALQMLLEGKNHGKMMVRVSH